MSVPASLVAQPSAAVANESLREATALCSLRAGQRARVLAVHAEADALLATRLNDLGFVPGESVQLLGRGPFGREPLLVRLGHTRFALLLREAACVQVLAD